MPSPELYETTLLKLRRYDWPGDVPAAKNLIEASLTLGALPVAFSGGGVAGPEAVAASIWPCSAKASTSALPAMETAASRPDS